MSRSPTPEDKSDRSSGMRSHSSSHLLGPNQQETLSNNSSRAALFPLSNNSLDAAFSSTVPQISPLAAFQNMIPSGYQPPPPSSLTCAINIGTNYSSSKQSVTYPSAASPHSSDKNAYPSMASFAALFETRGIPMPPSSEYVKNIEQQQKQRASSTKAITAAKVNMSSTNANHNHKKKSPASFKSATSQISGSSNLSMHQSLLFQKRQNQFQSVPTLPCTIDPYNLPAFYSYFRHEKGFTLTDEQSLYEPELKLDDQNNYAGEPITVAFTIHDVTKQYFPRTKLQCWLCETLLDRAGEIEAKGLEMISEVDIPAEKSPCTIEFQISKFHYHGSKSSPDMRQFFRFLLINSVTTTVISFIDSSLFSLTAQNAKHSEQKDPVSNEATNITAADKQATTNDSGINNIASTPQQQAFQENISELFNMSPPAFINTFGMFRKPEKRNKEIVKAILSRILKKDKWHRMLAHLEYYFSGQKPEMKRVYFQKGKSSLKRVAYDPTQVQPNKRARYVPDLQQFVNKPAFILSICDPYGPTVGGIPVQIFVNELDIIDLDCLSLRFGSARVSKDDIFYVSPNEIRCLLPAQYEEGNYDVSISVDDEVHGYSYVHKEGFKYMSLGQYIKRKDETREIFSTDMLQFRDPLILISSIATDDALIDESSRVLVSLPTCQDYEKDLSDKVASNSNRGSGVDALPAKEQFSHLSGFQLPKDESEGLRQFQKILHDQKRNYTEHTRVSQWNPMGQSPLHRACFSGTKSEMAKALQNGYSAKTCDYFDRTPMHLAFAAGYLEAAEFLLKETDSFETLLYEDFYYMTPFHLAVKYNKIEFLNKICDFIQQKFLTAEGKRNQAPEIVVTDTPNSPYARDQCSSHPSTNSSRSNEKRMGTKSPDDKIHATNQREICQFNPIIDPNNPMSLFHTFPYNIPSMNHNFPANVTLYDTSSCSPLNTQNITKDRSIFMHLPNFAHPYSGMMSEEHSSLYVENEQAHQSQSQTQVSAESKHQKPTHKTPNLAPISTKVARLQNSETNENPPLVATVRFFKNSSPSDNTIKSEEKKLLPSPTIVDQAEASTADNGKKPTTAS